MSVGELLRELARQGAVLRHRDGRVWCRSLRDGDGGRLVSALRDHKAELLAVLTGQRAPRPNLVDLNREWRARTGCSVRNFLGEFLCVTGCDLHERNPEWVELYTFAAHTEALGNRGSEAREESA